MSEVEKKQGVWKKGDPSPNPNGRPRKHPVESIDDLRKIEKLLRKACPEAVKLLISAMQSATSQEAKTRAATLIIDKLVVVSKELDRQEDRAGGKVSATPEEGEEKPTTTRVSFTLQRTAEEE